MTKWELDLLYKNETGSYPVEGEELEFEVFRSKGQWILNITDEEMHEMGWKLRYDRSDPDYLDWLERKLMELL
jgi:hypothetical protein